MGRYASILLRLGVIAVLSAGLALQGLAQPGGPPRGGMSDSARVERLVSDLKERLALTPAQETKIRDAATKTLAATRKEMEGLAGDHEAMRAAAQKRMARLDAAIEPVLTAEQKPKYEAYKTERRQQMRDRQGPPPPPK